MPEKRGEAELFAIARCAQCYDDGHKDGINMVVAWLEKNCACFEPESSTKWMDSWQKQLKEWGVR